MTDTTVTMSAERRDGLWTLYAIPDGAHTDADRLALGSGSSGTGVMFPLVMLDQFAARQAQAADPAQVSG